MSKNTYNNRGTVFTIHTIFDDLDKYRKFCQDYGYKYDESELYSARSNTFRQFQRVLSGNPVRNQWELDLAKFKEQEVLGKR